MQGNKSYSAGPFKITVFPEGETTLEFNRYVLEEYLKKNKASINFTITLSEMK